MGDELTDSELERYELEEEALEDDALCTCDIDGEDSCPIHYPIDDGGDDDDCMECGVCENCTERTKEFYEYSEKAERSIATNDDETGLAFSQEKAGELALSGPEGNSRA